MNKSNGRWRLFLVGLVILFLAACAPQDDEKALIELVERAAAWAEEHDIGKMMDLTTEDFQAQPGDLDRQGTKGILFMAFRHYGELKVVHPRPGVELQGREGSSVSVPFLIVKKEAHIPDLKELYNDPKRWLEKVGENADLYQFKFRVVKKEGKWLVQRALLEHYAGVGFEE